METDFTKWDFGKTEEKPAAPDVKPQPVVAAGPSEAATAPVKSAAPAEPTTGWTTQAEASKEKPQKPAEEGKVLKTASKVIDIKLWWKTIMATVAEKRVTDIHFDPEAHDATIRVSTEIGLYQRLGKENYEAAILHTTPKEKQEEMQREGEADFAVTEFGRRMRVNIFKTLKGLAAAYRPLPNESIPWKDNCLSQEIMNMIDTTKKGLILVTGPTGSGKSTTLCSMLEHINEMFPYHIITIEDPIEYIFKNKKCIIHQREVGEHTKSFQNALRAAMRENPDIIFVGEIRDYETARTALMAADTGHLVFGTLHTSRVFTTISRLLEMAPETSRSEMRSMMSNSLAMVMCQRLLQKRGGGLWPCREVMMMNPAISSMIKGGKEKGINNQLTINQSRGMMEWGKALEIGLKNGMITDKEMEMFWDSSEDFE